MELPQRKRDSSQRRNPNEKIAGPSGPLFRYRLSKTVRFSAIGACNAKLAAVRNRMSFSSRASKREQLIPAEAQRPAGGGILAALECDPGNGHLRISSTFVSKQQVELAIRYRGGISPSNKLVGQRRNQRLG